MGRLHRHGSLVSMVSAVLRYRLIKYRQALRMGRTFAIDLTECDAPLPRNYADGIREGDAHASSNSASVFPCFRFLTEFTQMSILLGRAREFCSDRESVGVHSADHVDKYAGSLLGLQSADDLSLLLLQMNIDSWTASLPTTWQYSVNLVLDNAPQLMNLFIVALEVSPPSP